MRYTAIMTLLGSRITYFLLIGIGAALGAYFFFLDREDQRIHATFQQTSCTVKASEVTVDEEIHHTMRGRGRYITRTYYPEITYTYKVNGQEYEGYDYRAFERGMTEEQANDVVDRYREGQTATCYYDPADPEDSLLTLDSDRRGMYYVGAWALFTLVGGLIGWVVIDFVLPSAESAARAAQEKNANFELEIPAWSSLPRPAGSTGEGPASRRTTDS
jgi:Protein of unknown function (DUF3592)